MALIPQSFLDELLSRVDIVPLIERHVPLKKAGRDYQACCPFHNEKTPSFTVAPAKQFYHCFGCGAHGTALSFLMQHQRLEFRDAVEELARMVGMELPREVHDTVQSQDAHAPLFALNAAAQKLYRDGLRGAPQALDYLRQRGLDRDTVNHFGIGFAPATWSHVLDTLGQPELLERAGLVIAREPGPGHYDRFRGRIMFPIRDRRGRIMGFGGRTLGDEKPKYLNSPETPLFHKGRQLYGIYELLQNRARPDRILVVEGYMDVVMLARHGIHNVVATLGTALTEEHLQLLYRLTGEVVFAFDGDRAGRAAAARALERTLPALNDAVAHRFLFLPEGEDPDSLVNREGSQAFLQRVSAAMPLSEFLLEELSSGLDLGQVDARAQLLERARKPLQSMGSAAFRSLFMVHFANIVQLPPGELERLLQVPATPEPTPPVVRKRRPDRGVHTTPVRRALQWLLEQPALAAQVADLDELAQVDVPGMPLLVKIIRWLQAAPELSAAAILERLRDQPEGRQLAQLLQLELIGEREQGATEFDDAIARLRQLARKQKLQALLDQINSPGGNAQALDEYRRLLQVQKK